MKRFYYEPPLAISKPHCIGEMEGLGLIKPSDVYDHDLIDLHELGIAIDNSTVIRAEAQSNTIFYFVSSNINKPFIIMNSVRLYPEDSDESILDHVIVGQDHVYAVISKNFREEALKFENMDYYFEEWGDIQVGEKSVDALFVHTELVRNRLEQKLVECVGPLPNPVQAIIAFCCYYSGTTGYKREDYPLVSAIRVKNITGFVKDGGVPFRGVFYGPIYKKRPTVDQQGVVKCLTGEDLPDGWVEDPFPKVVRD